MTAFDVIAILVLMISAAVGFMRGGAREVVTVVAFTASVALAVLGLHLFGPIARKAIHPSLLANAAAALGVFIVSYVLLWMLGRMLTRSVREAEMLSGLDRAAGVGFGLVRGLVLMGVFYILFNAATPPERAPLWVKHAALYPLSGAAGHMLLALAPKGQAMAGKLGPALMQTVKESSTDSPPRSRPKPASYNDHARKSVDDLVERSR